MRHARIVAVSAVLAFACALPGAASAGKTLELSTSEGPIGAGAALNLTGVESFETPDGTVECPDGLLSATLLQNASAKVRVSIEAGPAAGAHGVLCSTSSSLGAIEVQAGGLPWTQQFAASGKGLLKGHKHLSLTVGVPAFLGLQCSYETKRIAETFPLGANGVAVPLELALGNQTFTRSSAGNVLCPLTVSANLAALPLTIDGSGGTLLPVFVTRSSGP